jgi:4-amino-4-deoxy-L-arabinose transferase-like glycosyltransferase
MDSVIFAIASILVLLSVSAFARPRQSWARDITIVILMAIVLAAGLLTKFTGLLLFSIPFLALIFFASQRFWQKLWMPAFACAIAFLLVFPYYYARYYREHGTWLPSNTNHFDAGPQLSARKARDEDRLAFFLSLFSPSPVHEQGIELRDLEHPRLSDTWKDFWMKDQWLTDGQQGEDSGFAPAMSRLYIFLMPFLILGGLLLSFTKSSSGPWKQLGRFLFFFSLLLLLALIAYIYKNPWAGSLANKAIYIAPFSWSLGFAVAQYFQFLKRFSTLRFLLCGIFCVFIALNFFIPVY